MYAGVSSSETSMCQVVLHATIAYVFFWPMLPSTPVEGESFLYNTQPPQLGF